MSVLQIWDILLQGRKPTIKWRTLARNFPCEQAITSWQCHSHFCSENDTSAVHCPSPPMHRHPTWHVGFGLSTLSLSMGDVCVSPKHLTPMQCLSPCRKARGGHNKDHGRQQDYLYLAAQTPLPKEAVVLQPQPCTKEAPRALPLPSATSGWSSTFVSGPQRHLFSILRDVLWFWRAPLPGEHYCSHGSWLFFVIATF